MLTTASLLVVLDSVAAGALVAKAALGVTSTDAGTVAKGAANNLATLQTEAAEDATVATLLSPFARRLVAVEWASLSRVLSGAAVQAALDAHYGGTGELNRALETADKRVHPVLRDVGVQVDPLRAFCPTVLSFGAMALSAPGVGVYTAGASVDMSTYGKANVSVSPTATIGAADVVATLTLTKENGDSETKAVTIPAGTTSGAVIAVGTPGADMYVACTAVTVSGGTAADQFAVKTTVERAVTL